MGKVRARIRFIKIALFVSIALSFLSVNLFIFGRKIQADSFEKSVSLTMLDVGQGLSVLLESDGEYLLYDGGGRETSSYVVSYLAQHGVNQLKYVIASHYDEDHIAGLIGVLYTTPVGTLLCPDYEADSAIYASFQNAVSENAADMIHPQAGETYQLGSTELEILGPPDEETENENNRSIVLLADTGSFRCMLTGDAETAEEEQMLSSGKNLSADLLIVGHHGSTSSTSTEFLKTVSPRFALISVGAENDYGHPAEDVLDRLTARGIEIHRTDLEGEIFCAVIGSECVIRTEYAEGQKPRLEGTGENSELPAVGESEQSAGNGSSGWTENPSKDAGSADETGSAEERTYILNTNTKKFHLPTCSSVNQMKEKNKATYTGTRDELIAQGYEPCQRCYP